MFFAIRGQHSCAVSYLLSCSITMARGSGFTVVHFPDGVRGAELHVFLGTVPPFKTRRRTPLVVARSNESVKQSHPTSFFFLVYSDYYYFPRLSSPKSILYNWYSFRGVEKTLVLAGARSISARARPLRGSWRKKIGNRCRSVTASDRACTGGAAKEGLRRRVDEND